ncbi:hypothetical protein H5410_015540 [Solanum commersonii]|uniref:Uncharacterized protein n=1 Tax=Solanum commersonii TaxID=4109 RepID=A0A9J5ZUQ4_SOLCO|nr:hypothetical protein H5410_015540 [Solanum commersonii]
MNKATIVQTIIYIRDELTPHPTLQKQALPPVLQNIKIIKYKGKYSLFKCIQWIPIVHLSKRLCSQVPTSIHVPQHLYAIHMVHNHLIALVALRNNECRTKLIIMPIPLGNVHWHNKEWCQLIQTLLRNTYRTTKMVSSNADFVPITDVKTLISRYMDRGTKQGR